MKFSRHHVSRFRNLVSAVFDALALAEWCVAALALTVKFVSHPFSRWVPAKIWALGQTGAEVAAFLVLALVFVQGLLFAAAKFAESRQEVPPEERAKKGYRGYEGGTPRKVSQRMRRRMVAALSSGSVS